jgi:hypothetical protein
VLSLLSLQTRSVFYRNDAEETPSKKFYATGIQSTLTRFYSPPLQPRNYPAPTVGDHLCLGSEGSFVPVF